MPRRAVDDIDLVRSGSQRRLGVANLALQRLAQKFSGLEPRGLRRRKLSRRRLCLINGAYERRRVVSLLLRLRENDGDGLSVPVDEVVLHDREIVATYRLGGRPMKRRPLQVRRVAVRHHQHNTDGGLGRACVERRDPALRNRAVRKRAVDHSFNRKLSREAGVALHLDRAVKARNRRANQTMLVLDKRVGVRAWHPGVRRELHRLCQDCHGGVFDDAHAPISISSPSTATIVRFASSTLKALSRRGAASASSASAAARKLSGAGRRPLSAASAFQARHGLWATPPSASRTSFTVSPSSSSAAATATRAKA